MKKLLTKEVLTRGIMIGLVAGLVTTVFVSGGVARADTIISALINNTTSGTLSTPALSLSGSWFTGGSSTTTKPLALVEPAGAISASWSTNGTGLGVNAASGFTGNVADFQLNGSSLLKVASTGTTSVNGTLDVSGGVTKNGTNALVPAGSMNMFAGSSAPAGYLICDGSSYSTATYPDLFAVIGYTYGGSSGTFTVPDMRGRFGEGVSSGVVGISNKTLGQTGGEETHTLTIGELPPHNFNVNLPATYDTLNLFGAFGQAVVAAGSQQYTTNTIGSGDAFNQLSPYLAVNYIIKY